MGTKHRFFIVSLIICGIFLILGGTSYALFEYIKSGKTESIMITNGITFNYNEGQNSLLLNDAMYMTDDQGKSQANYFEFTIQSRTPDNIEIPYYITVRKLDNSSNIDEAIKLYLTKVDNNSEEEVELVKYSDIFQYENNSIDLSKYEEKLLHEDKVKSDNYNQTYRLRMWIDYNTDFIQDKYQNATFNIKVNVYSSGRVAVTDNSEFVLRIIKDKKLLLEEENSDIQIKYNTVLVPMDKVLSMVIDDYQPGISQTLTYNTVKMNIDLDNNEINFPKRTVIKPGTYGIGVAKWTEEIDETDHIDIEYINDTKYIPLYLISKLKGVGVSINNKNIYTNKSNLNSVDALSSNRKINSININLNYDGEVYYNVWKEEALKRIEKYRKKEVTFVVKDKNGNLIDNSNINLIMNSNDFKFGTAIRYDYQKKQNIYTNITTDIFNAIGSENGFKWPLLLDKYNVGVARDVANFALNHNMYLRGHCLWWDNNNHTIVNNVAGTDTNQEIGTMIYIYNEYNSGRITLEQANQMIDELKINFERMLLEHVGDEISSFPEVNEWDVTNELTTSQFFKYYLYDKGLLTTNNFINEKQYMPRNYFTTNTEYEHLLAKLFDKARAANPNAKLVLNENVLRGTFSEYAEEIIKIASRLNQYTNNIDSFGIQYHVDNKHYQTPQAYYNQILRIVNETGIDDIVVTEYDDFVTDKLGNYTKEDDLERARYLEDTLIGLYSNTYVREFIFWVYNSTSGKISNEERNAYVKLVNGWLHDSKSGVTSNGLYSVRLHPGTYTANISDGKISKQLTVNVKKDMEPIEIIMK